MKNFRVFLSLALIFLALTACTNEVSLENDLTQKVITFKANEYKLQHLEISYDDSKEKEMFLNKLKYQTFNNQPVEYIETFNPLE